MTQPIKPSRWAMSRKRSSQLLIWRTPMHISSYCGTPQRTRQTDRQILRRPQIEHVPHRLHGNQPIKRGRTEGKMKNHPIKNNTPSITYKCLFCHIQEAPCIMHHGAPNDQLEHQYYLYGLRSTLLPTNQNHPHPEVTHILLLLVCHVSLLFQ